MGKSPLCVEVSIMHLDRDVTISSNIARSVLKSFSHPITQIHILCNLSHFPSKAVFWFYSVLLLLFVGDVYLVFWQNH